MLFSLLCDECTQGMYRFPKAGHAHLVLGEEQMVSGKTDRVLYDVNKTHGVNSPNIHSEDVQKPQNSWNNSSENL